jgi:hypothetical protein
VGTVYVDHTNSPTASVELAATATVGQVFVAEYDGLCSVQVKLENQAERNEEVLTFHLQESSSGGYDYAILDLDASEVNDRSYLLFEFPCIRHSAGESFYFYLEGTLQALAPPVRVVGSTEDTYPHGEAVLLDLEENNTVRDLVFRLGYDPPLLDKAEILLDRIVTNKPSLWGDKYLYIALALAHLALVYVLFLRVTGPDTEEDRLS